MLHPPPQQFATITSAFLTMYANQNGLIDLSLMRDSHNPVCAVLLSGERRALGCASGGGAADAGACLSCPCCNLCRPKPTAAVAYAFVMGMVIVNVSEMQEAICCGE